MLIDNAHAANQANSLPFIKLEGSLRVSQQLPLVPIL
jgi:hypothetical protein